MRVKDFRWLFLAALAAFLVVSNLPEVQELGMSYKSSSNGSYRFAGGTALWPLVLAIVVVGLYFLFLNAEPADMGQPLPTVFRRFIAFFLDFLLAIAALAPVVGVAPVLAEWRRTGVFQWSFEREMHVPGDGLVAMVVLLLGATGLIVYYALPLVLRKPSPGTCILGYQVVPDTGVSMTLRAALLRTLLGFIAVGTWYIAPLIARDRKNGKFWLDKVFSTRAVRIT